LPSRFPHSDLDLDFFRQKIQINKYKHCKRVPCAYTYHFILLESVINTVFHRNYRGGLVKWIQDYEDAFTELALLGQNTWDDYDINKRRFVQNVQNIGFVDTVFEELVIGKFFIETCNRLRSHAIRLDRENKEKAARQIHNTSQ
jgi:hypothetical protein